MTRSTFILIFAICAILQLQAQKVELVLTGGMAGYSMRDLKTLNSELQGQIPFNTVVTDDFPMTFQFGGHFAVVFSKNYKLGLLYAFNSTGSRIASGDYSGSYHFDNVVSGQTIGMLNGFRMYDYKAFRVDFQANIGLVYSNLKMNEELSVADTTISSSSKYTALGIFLEPRAEFSYQWKNLKGGIYIGYFVNPMGKIRNANGQQSTSTINWSGLRFGIEIGITGGSVKTKGEKAGKTKDSY